jgi:hypothetical protein
MRKIGSGVEIGHCHVAFSAFVLLAYNGPVEAGDMTAGRPIT